MSKRTKGYLQFFLPKKGSSTVLSCPQAYDEDGAVWVNLGSIEELKKAMTTTGNHKLDLQVTLTARGSGNGDESQWIIPR